MVSDPYLYTLIAKPEDLIGPKTALLNLELYRLARNIEIPEGYVEVTHIYGRPVYDQITHKLNPKFGAVKRWKIDNDNNK